MDNIEHPVFFGDWLKRRRKSLDLTQEELAQRASCSVFALRKIEAGDRRPSKQLAESIASALGVLPEDHHTFIRVARGELNLERLQPPSLAPAAGYAPEPTTPSPRIHLPVPPTPFIGRHPELDSLGQLLQDPHCRLLTLVGPGGIGKTRLAIQVASQHPDLFPDGVCFVPLASLTSSAFLVPTIVKTLGFSLQGEIEPHVQLLNYLRAKQVLLVLDNMEHLLESAGLIADILECGQKVKLLVTSRERLNLRGEWVFEIQGLPLPPLDQVDQAEQYSAVAFFVQSARRSQTSFELGAEERSAVIRICQIVEGMPLGIELAAAWVSVLTCSEIAQELERNLDFLKTSLRDIPDRHHSLRAVFDHSWRMLTPEEQGALSQLSVFRGGFGREAAAQVAGASLILLSALVAKSLLHYDTDGHYSFHEVIRQFALLHLQADTQACTATQERHFDFYLSLAESLAPLLRGAGQLESIDRLELEHDNLRAALEWSLETNGELALRLAVALHWFWYMRGHYRQGYRWMEKALQRSPDKRSPIYARALNGAGMLAYRIGDEITAMAMAEESLGILRELGDKLGLADTYTLMTIMLEGTDSSRVLWYCEEALALYREVGHPWSIARGLYNLGSVLVEFGDRESGRALIDESAQILEKLGDRYILPFQLHALGMITYERGDYLLARSYMQHGLAVAREMRNPRIIALLSVGMGHVFQAKGDYPTAHSYFDEALQMYRLLGGAAEITALVGLVENEIAQGNLPAATNYVAEISAHSDTSQSSSIYAVPAIHQWCQGLLAYYQGDIEHSAALLEEVREITKAYPNKVREGWLCCILGHVARQQGNLPRAEKIFRESLTAFFNIDHQQGIATCLEGLSGTWAADHPQSAAVLLGAAETIRESIGAPIPPVDCPRYDQDLATLRAHLAGKAFEKAWAQGQKMNPEEAVTYALDNK